MNREPSWQKNQLNRDGGYVLPGELAELRQQDARKDIGAQETSTRQDRRARPHHVWFIGAVADHPQAEIGLHRRADVESTAVEQRPAAMLTLDAAQKDADLAFQFRIVRFA